VKLDEGNMWFEEEVTKIPSSLLKPLRNRLARATKHFVRSQQQLKKVDYAFNTHFIDPDEQGEDLNILEVRDAFLEFMTSLMQGYTKCLIAPKAQNEIFHDSRDFFDFQKFKKAKDATKENSLVFKLCDTTLFSNFIEARSFGKSDCDDQILFFDDVSSRKRTSKLNLLLSEFVPKRTVIALGPLDTDLSLEQIYQYETFVSMSKNNFYQPREVENFNEAIKAHLKNIIGPETLQKMNEQEWARYLAEAVYLIWF